MPRLSNREIFRRMAAEGCFSQLATDDGWERVTPRGGLFGHAPRRRLQPSTGWERVQVDACLAPSAVAEPRNVARSGPRYPTRAPEFPLLPTLYAGSCLLFNAAVDRADNVVAFAPTAFDRELELIAAGERQCYVTASHAQGHRAAWTPDGSLKLAAGHAVLQYSLKLYDSEYGRRIARGIMFREFTGVSMGYVLVKSERRTAVDGTPVDFITEAALIELSFSNAPAFCGTTIKAWVTTSQREAIRRVLVR